MPPPRPRRKARSYERRQKSNAQKSNAMTDQLPVGFVRAISDFDPAGGFVRAKFGAASRGGFVRAISGPDPVGGFVRAKFGAASRGGFVRAISGADPVGGFVRAIFGADPAGGFVRAKFDAARRWVRSGRMTTAERASPPAVRGPVLFRALARLAASFAGEIIRRLAICSAFVLRQKAPGANDILQLTGHLRLARSRWPNRKKKGRKTWMPATSAGMTVERHRPSSNGATQSRSCSAGSGRSASASR